MTARSIVSKVATAMKPSMATLGFRRDGLAFVRAGTEVVSLIELQVSRESDARVAHVAINYGVVVPALVAGLDIKRPSWTECHWQKRFADAEGQELWWGVRATETPESVAERIRGWLESTVLPALERVQRESDLIAWWLGGRGSGLTLHAQFVCLGKLLRRAGRLEELRKLSNELASRTENPTCQRAAEELRGLLA